MKRILLALAVLILFLPAAPTARAQTEVSIDFFYNNLNDGNWVEVGDYGYCWQPSVAVSNSDWRPYADGYWAYTDVGWTWVSNEDFGWATYHYGRWVRLEDQGWMWVPGYEWGPAWVSWRTGGDYVGWAPLPPSREPVYEGRAITGHVDVEFDIGPTYYNFVDVRYIGEPVLRERIVPATQNITVISNTVNVTNITYTNSTVYNYGPDYNQVSRYSVRPVQRLTLQRETDANFSVGVTSRSVTKVEGQKLVIAAPLKIQRAAKTVAPKNVKTKIAQAKIEHGWSGVSDPKIKTQLVEKMKSEDAKNVPPPKVAPNQNAAAAGASPATGVSPAQATGAAVTPAAPVATATPAEAAPSTAPAMTSEKGKRGGKRGEMPAASSSATVPSENAEATPHGRGRGHQTKPTEQTAPTPRSQTEIDANESQPDRQGRGKGHRERQGEGEAIPKPTPNAMEHDNAAGMAPDAQSPRRQKASRDHNEKATAPPEAGAISNEQHEGRRQRQNELAPTGRSADAEARQGSRNAPDGAHRQPAGGEDKKEGGHQKEKGAEASPTPGG
jgi:uncharacterized protein DUF6600